MKHWKAEDEAFTGDATDRLAVYARENIDVSKTDTKSISIYNKPDTIRV